MGSTSSIARVESPHQHDQERQSTMSSSTKARSNKGRNVPPPRIPSPSPLPPLSPNIPGSSLTSSSTNPLPLPPNPVPSPPRSRQNEEISQDEVDAPLFDQQSVKRLLSGKVNSETGTVMSAGSSKERSTSETQHHSSNVEDKSLDLTLNGRTPMKDEKIATGTQEEASSGPKVDTKTTIMAMDEADLKTMENLRESNPEFDSAFDGLLMFVSALKEDLGLQKDETFLQNCMERDVMNAFMSGNDRSRGILSQFFALIGGPGVLYDSYFEIMSKLNMTFMTDVTLYAISNQATMMFIVNLRGAMWNYSDASLLFCEKLGNTGMFEYLARDLTNMKSGIQKPSTGLGYSFESCVGILHNVSKCPAARNKMRSKDIALLLQPYLKCQDTKVKLVTLLTMANLLHESQNHVLLADQSVFDFILRMIKMGWKRADHRYDGFSVQELVEGLTGLAKNDDNKKLIVKKGAVPLLLSIMKGGDQAEIKPAVACVWELAFDKDNKKAFNDDEKLKDLLKSLRNSADKEVSKAAAGAIWEIHLEDVDQSSSKPGPDTLSGHVMISYQWADQKKLMQVRDSLRGSGFQVWMDIDNMGGSTLQAMAEAVQNAAVVLVCMSERYKESQNCRSEAEYAFSLQKPIVPLLMERGYKPDGWLGMIKGTKLFFDFSGKYEYEHKVADLIRELGGRGREAHGHPIDALKVPVIRAGPVDAGKGPSIAAWSNKDVLNWLKKSEITITDSLRDLSGQQLVFLRKLSHRAPEFYFAYIERKLKLDTVEKLMLFSNALDSL